MANHRKHQSNHVLRDRLETSKRLLRLLKIPRPLPTQVHTTKMASISTWMAAFLIQMATTLTSGATMSLVVTTMMTTSIMIHLNQLQENKKCHNIIKLQKELRRKLTNQTIDGRYKKLDPIMPTKTHGTTRASEESPIKVTNGPNLHTQRSMLEAKAIMLRVKRAAHTNTKKKMTANTITSIHLRATT